MTRKQVNWTAARLVENNNELLLIHVFNSGLQQPSPDWEMLCGRWSGYATFLTLDLQKAAEIERQFPFAGHSLPYTLSSSAKGRPRIVDLEKLQRAVAFRELFGTQVKPVAWDYVKQFLDQSVLHYKRWGLPRFNVLLLRHDPETPFSFLHKAINNNGLINFGVVDPIDRAKVVRYLKLNRNSNIIFGFMGFGTSASRELQPYLKERLVDILAFTRLINLATRHTLVGTIDAYS